ncbi:LacI family DNA-binding transcriptional regulator [Opitutales bacterium ASA1]|uniref:LacI family DNA-binding transcriptional regulator n=1 Tax=Congregicoccus parvus TaxID=3081749 RepID=UPI002B2CE6CD|nr:LacI family DNA-binding transcriptional regulator [Opitutales bacterium ASA1]
MPSGPNRKPDRAPTLADVGRVAGVSAVAASAVLNSSRTSSRIAPKTRARILAAAAQLGYRANGAARALAKSRMNVIGVAVVVRGGDLDHYFLEVFNGVIEKAAATDQNAMVFTLHDWHADVQRLPEFCDGRIDGMILVGPLFTPEHAALLPRHTPFVALHANHDLPGVVNIESDEEIGAYNLVRYLVDQGHRRILHLAGHEHLLGAQRRLRGYRRALADCGIKSDDSLVVDTGYDLDDGRRAMRKWLAGASRQPLPHAVFCVNDMVAVGCMDVLAENGFKVPDDISVAGFDDSLAARTTVPQLTSVRQQLRKMGAAAVDALLAHIDHRKNPAVPVTWGPIVFPTEIVQRASVLPPPSTSRRVPATIVAG